MSAVKVSAIIGANEATIRKWINDSGNSIKVGGVYNTKYDKSLVFKIANLYNKGYYTSEIEKELNLKKGVASYLLRKNGYKLRHRGPKSMIGKEDYFDIIDNGAKAYFLGWLMADGNISITNNQYSLKIHIALRDRELIDKFLLEIESKNKTKIKNLEKPSYYVSLTSVHMCKRLMELGIVPRKTGKEVFPREIPENLHYHFIRGLFDGDGITDVKKKRSGFVGSLEIINRVLDIIDEKQLKVYGNKKNPYIFYFLGGKKFSRKLYYLIYKDSTIWLERKRLRMEEICFNDGTPCEWKHSRRV